MNNIFDYVTRREATESKLISGVNCSPESALDEFRFVKKRFHKEDGRSYYHIVQSFSPDDNLMPETAHEIGLKFAEYFPGSRTAKSFTRAATRCCRQRSIPISFAVNTD